MLDRRIVRVAQPFFDRLDELLPGDRTAEGLPSATDFLLHELPSVIEKLATDFEASTFVVRQDPVVRAFVSAGVLVAYLVVYAILNEDDFVEVLHLEIDHHPPDS